MTVFDDLGTVQMEEGLAAAHANRSLPLYVAPATRDAYQNTVNTMRMTLNPVACWRINDARFAFDSSFVAPEARQELRQLAKMIKSAPECPLSIFGHTDPVGNDPYNLVLGQRRARSIHCILTRDIDEWKDLYSSQELAGDIWSNKGVDGIMLSAIGYSSSKDDIEQFQKDYGLSVDGTIGQNSRPVLAKRYMDWLCPVTLKKEAFLGGGKDKQGKGDYQSCGEFNAVLLLNNTEENKTDPNDPKHLQRNADNSVNRRVVIFFFQPGTVVDPAVWPCPAAPRTQAGSGAAKAACKKRFWADSDQRIKPLDGPDPNADPNSARGKDGNRAFKETLDTWACRFYQRIAGWSPCEGGQKTKYWVIRLLHPNDDGPPPEGKPVANRGFEASGSGGRKVAGQTDENGVLRVRVHDDTEDFTVKIAAGPDPNTEPERQNPLPRRRAGGHPGR